MTNNMGELKATPSTAIALSVQLLKLTRKRRKDPNDIIKAGLLESFISLTTARILEPYRDRINKITHESTKKGLRAVYVDNFFASIDDEGFAPLLANTCMEIVQGETLSRLEAAAEPVTIGYARTRIEDLLYLVNEGLSSGREISYEEVEGHFRPSIPERMRG